ncbi:MAG TPA: ferritin-like domain-containing protein [Candidatus Margulisiibacteriota bacterium]|nr:ferritin-like domain-containing protein [Candidatus Margulisiibacteriota bacterium]
MATDSRTILLMNYYRDAELRGANLLFRLMSHLEDPDSQLKLSLHLADETRHAALWTKRISDCGGAPARIADGYQNRIGLRVVPRNLIDILALTVVVEERAYQRYMEHSARPDVDPEILAVLREVTKDEKWHISWIKAKLEEIAAAEGGVQRMNEALARYREIDRQVYAELLAKERAAFAEPEQQPAAV